MEKISSQTEGQLDGGIISEKLCYRKKSLFDTEGAEHKDVGHFVLAHADFPSRQRSWSHPQDPTKILSHTTGFNTKTVKDVIKNVILEKIGHKKYDSKVCSVLARKITEDIKEKVSELNVPKGYKVICTCTISENMKPSFTLESGFAWEDGVTSVERDKFAEYVYKNVTLMAIGTVYIVDCNKVRLLSKKRSQSLRSNSLRPATIPE